MKCNCGYCGTTIDPAQKAFDFVKVDGKNLFFCRESCKYEWTECQKTLIASSLLNSSEQQKHEEIKQKAWEIILSAGYNSDDDKVRRFISSRTAWNKAERFYDYTKEKEKGNDDNDR